uniref:B30.2/SPRY domain-containing protein n=1 Tax=Chrysemys picta bellii TaxID=8478 RepID=A0A8C3HWM9_CHRPI
MLLFHCWVRMSCTWGPIGTCLLCSLLTKTFLAVSLMLGMQQLQQRKQGAEASASKWETNEVGLLTETEELSLGSRPVPARTGLLGSVRNGPMNVTLDPDTAYPNLVLSENWKRVGWGHTQQDLPNNPERFDTRPCVLGCEGFISGRHCWEVEVVAGQGWAVGVARESVGRKGWISRSPEGGIWAVEQWERHFQALTSPVTPLPLSRFPSRIRVCLDCDQGQVTFIDAGDEAPIFTFPPGSVPGERIRPWLQVWRSQLRLCP